MVTLPVPVLPAVLKPTLAVALEIALSICCLLTAELGVVPAATFLISVLPALIPPVVTEIGLPPPAGVIVIPPPLITVVLLGVVKVALLKPVNALAMRMFNVPVVASPRTAMLPDVRSAAVVEAPPLMLSFSPCLRVTTVVSSPPKSCLASVVALLTALVIAVSICVLLTAELPDVAGPTFVISLPPASIPLFLSITTPPTVTLSKDTFLAVPIVMERPVFVIAMLSPLTKLTVSPPDTAVVPAPLVSTFQEAADFARFWIYVLPAVDKLDKSLLAEFSAAVTAALNLAVGAIVTSSPVADVVMSAFAPVSPLMLNLIPPVVLNFLAVVVPESLPKDTLLSPNVVTESVAAFTASSICFLLTAASSVVALPTCLISVLPASIPDPAIVTV